MKQRLTLVTIGVADLVRAREFYERLGWHSDTDPEMEVAFFQSGGMVVSLWDREKLAEDSGLPLGDGYGAVTFAHNVASEAEVDAVIEEARAAGAMIAKEPKATFWGGYSGVFLDLDSHPWEVAHNPHWSLSDDGTLTLPR